jgi:acetyl-CoA carboxylase biotin carboxyl carrier protein
MSDSHTNPRDEVLSLEHIRQLAELMQEYGLSELELRDDEQRVRLARGITTQTSPAAMPLPSLDTPSGAAIPSASTPDAAGSTEPAENVVIIRSPMVGTFYNKPNPDAETYVRVGDHVGPESIVCIIEAMKVFNEIPAEVSGRVIAVLADNEEAVDFDRPLFKIDTSG